MDSNMSYVRIPTGAEFSNKDKVERWIASQPVPKLGYKTDNFPSKYYNKPGKAQPLSPQYNKIERSSQPSFPFLNSVNPEAVSQRIVDILNHCRYLATKAGMDKRELIESIKRDEIEAANYFPMVLPSTSIYGQPFISPSGIEWSFLLPSWTGLNPQCDKCRWSPQDADCTGDFLNRPLPSHPFFDCVRCHFENPSVTSIIPPRPPTRRSATPLASDFCPKDYPGGQSDTGSGETCSTISVLDLLSDAMIHRDMTANEMNYDTYGLAPEDHVESESKDPESVHIPPVRKAGTHNLPLRTPKTPCNSQIQILNQNEDGDEEMRNENTSSETDSENSGSEEELDEYEEDPRNVFLKDKFKVPENPSVSSVFGNLDQFDKLLSDADDQLKMRQTRE